MNFNNIEDLPDMDIDPDKVRRKSLGLPVRFEDEEETVSTRERISSLVVMILTYLYTIKVTFDTRIGPRKIIASLTPTSGTKDEINELKSFYESIGLTAHTSGEFPSPSNLEIYRYLECVDFSDDYSSFIPKNITTYNNAMQKELHQAAITEFTTRYCDGSSEMAENRMKDRVAEEKSLLQEEQKIQVKVDSLSKEDHNLPDNCYFKIHNRQVALAVGSYCSLIAIKINGIYDEFNNTKLDDGTRSIIFRSYETYKYYEHDIFEENKAILLSRFESIESMEIPIAILQGLKDEMHYRIDYRCDRTGAESIISDGNREILKQMIEDFFEV